MVLDAKLARTRLETVAISLALMPHEVRMGHAKNDIDRVRTGLDDARHGINHSLDTFAWREQTEREDDHFSAEAKLRFGVMCFKERKVGYSVRYDFDLASRHVMNRTKDVLAFFRHHDELRRRIDDPPDHVVLDRRGFAEYRMQRCDKRHFKTRQELNDMGA